MPVVNPLARELVFKIVFYGPGLGGKTTTLQHIHATAKPEHRGKLVSLATPVDRTLYFDFLPIRVPHAHGMNIRLQLFTVPGQVHYNATRKLVLTGADGVVLVFDSQRARVDANLETLENLKDNLNTHGKALHEVPHVIQYNKRDLYDVTPIDELERSLNRLSAPSFSTVATTGEGVYESLESITRSVLEDFERRLPASRAFERVSLAVPEGGMADALRRAESAGSPLATESRATYRHATGALGLSEFPETDIGEAAARAVTGGDVTVVPARLPTEPPSPGSAFSFGALFPESEQGAVLTAETALSRGDSAAALGAVEQLVSRALASGAALVGSSHDAPRDPGLVVLLLGLEPRRYLRFRAVAREARNGGVISSDAALAAYAFALDVRRALWELG